MKSELLNQKELNKLIGGQYNQDCEADDINNNNSVSGCWCSYENSPNAIANNNTAEGCLCLCQ